MARLFVAVYPPPSVVAELARLPRAESAGVRWTPPDQYHVTVRFLGNADPAVVSVALDGVANECSESHVRLGPRVSRLGRTVICVPAAGLEALATTIGRATSDLGDPPDPRPFRGHVTLARLRRRAACGLAGTPYADEFLADEMHLVQSTTRREGAEHRRLRRWSLGA